MSSERYDGFMAWVMVIVYGLFLLGCFVSVPFMFLYAIAGEGVLYIRKRLRFSKEGSDVA